MTVRYTIAAESDGERILKIGQHLPKLWARIKCPDFLTHGVYVRKIFRRLTTNADAQSLCGS